MEDVFLSSRLAISSLTGLLKLLKRSDSSSKPAFYIKAIRLVLNPGLFFYFHDFCSGSYDGREIEAKIK